MLSKLWHGTLPVLVLAACVVGFLSLGRKEPPPTRETTQAAAPLVETVAIQPATSELTIQIDGLVSPYREVTTAAEVSGRVSKKSASCRAGDYVRKGELLLEIDSRDYQHEVDRLETELSQATVKLDELEVEIKNNQASTELAQKELKLQGEETARVQRLASRGVATESESQTAQRSELVLKAALLNLENQLRSQQASRKGLEHSVELAESRLASARLNLTRTRITAPFDGIVVKEPVEVDEYVVPGAELLTLEDTSAAEIRCSLTMDDFGWLWSQQSELGESTASPSELNPARDYRIPPTVATVTYQMGGREYVWEGTLSRYDGWGLDERTRTLPCRVLVSNPTEGRVRAITDAKGASRLVSTASQSAGPPALMRGMYVTVQLHAQPDLQLVKLPGTAIRPGNRIWQVESGRLAIRPVVVARATKESVLLDAAASGLEPGDQVVVSPLAAPREGMPVQSQQTGKIGLVETDSKLNHQMATSKSAPSLSSSRPNISNSEDRS